MAGPLRVLIVEDEPADAELMVRELRRAGFNPDWHRVETEPGYLARLNPPPDVILADYSLPEFGARRALSLLQERGMDVPFIVVAGSISEEVAVECMKQGATDYLFKTGGIAWDRRWRRPWSNTGSARKSGRQRICCGSMAP